MSRAAFTRGFTGQEIAIPGEDAGAINSRIERYEAELQPNSALARDLVGRIALMVVRLDRSAKQEAKATAYRMRNAGSEFDDARLAEADHLISWIAHEPATNHRRLKRSPEGISVLIAKLEALRSDLTRQPSTRWNSQHCDQLHNLLGFRREEVPVTRARALSEAIQGKFQDLEPDDAPGMETMEKRRWAIARLFDLIEVEIGRLKTQLTTFDREAIEVDRAEAADRAIFDDSKTGVLARKFEAATERGLYRALREFRAIQAETVTEPQVEAKLGSFLPEPPATQDASMERNPSDPEAAVPVEEQPSELVEDGPDRPEDGFDSTSGGFRGPGRATCRGVRDE